MARVRATSSLIPAVNKLGTVPLLLGTSEELEQRYLPAVARGEAMFCYAQPDLRPAAREDTGPSG